MSKIMIELNQVTKRFGTHPVVDDLSFQVRPGEILGLIGPNGSGKTTTIRLINGVLRPNTGSIAVNGYDPIHDGDAIRRASGILTESAGFYAHMSGLENLRFFAALYGVTDQNRPMALLEEFGLAAHRDQKAGAYSTGMKKRLGLAKALLHEPEILFLDEPTNGLDPEGMRMVLDYIHQLNRRHGTTIILCSHLLQQLEVVCHRYLFLNGGRLVEQGTLTELEARYAATVRLQVETNLRVESGLYRDIPVRTISEGLIELTLSGKEAVPAVMQQLTQDAAVYGATMVGRDLESIYFKIREVTRHG